MNVLPIQITEDAVIIPRAYLHDADAVEATVEGDFVILRPKAANGEKPEAGISARRLAFIGIGETRSPNASVEAETILEKEINRQGGWSKDK